MLSWDVCHMSLCLFLVYFWMRRLSELPLCIWHIDYCVSVCVWEGEFVSGDLKYKCAFIESAPSVSRSSWFVLMCSDEQLGELSPSTDPSLQTQQPAMTAPWPLWVCHICSHARWPKSKKAGCGQEGLGAHCSIISFLCFIDQPLTDGFNDDSRQSASHRLLIRSFTELNCYSLIG